jgi:hypothetical protein
MKRPIKRGCCSPCHKPDKFIEADATVPVLVDLVNQLLKISAVVSDATVPVLVDLVNQLLKISSVVSNATVSPEFT